MNPTRKSIPGLTLGKHDASPASIWRAVEMIEFFVFAQCVAVCILLGMLWVSALEGK